MNIYSTFVVARHRSAAGHTYKVSHSARFLSSPPSLRPPSLSFLSTPLFTMTPLLSFFFLITAVSRRVSASIGPNAQLDIANLELAPDGFSRSFVLGLLIARCGIDP